MKHTIFKNLLRTGLLAATALSAAACVVEPAYGPAYSGSGYYYTPAPVYVGPSFEYHDHDRWHHDRDDRDGYRHEWH